MILVPVMEVPYDLIHALHRMEDIIALILTPIHIVSTQDFAIRHSSVMSCPLIFCRENVQTAMQQEQPKMHKFEALFIT